MDKLMSIAAVTMATAVAACTASQGGVKVQPVLSFDGTQVKDSGTAEYEKGKQLLKQGRFALAAQAFQAALFTEGSSVRLLNALAVSYDKLGRYDLSDRYYQRALALNPNDLQTTNNIAVSLAQRGAPDLAAKVLAEAHAQRPSDATIAGNLKLAQKEATVAPTVAAAAPLPTPIAAPVPRIEPTSPSTQQLVTFGVHVAAAPHQLGLAPVVVNKTTNVRIADETQSPVPTASASLPAVVSEPRVSAQKIAAVSADHPSVTLQSLSAQRLVGTDAGRSDAGLKPAAPTLMVSRTADSAPTDMDEARTVTVSAPEVRPAIVSETLIPPPAIGKAEPPKTQKIAVHSLQTAGAPTAEHQKAVPTQLASATPAIRSAQPVTESSMMALARSRLGSRIAESDNIQPLDIAARKSPTSEFALARLGVRVEIANGAGRRYMAARMRTFLDGHGFDVAHVTNARSFEHTQTVIVYRDQYEPQAIDLAKSLATKVELVHVADLPVDVRVILGRDLLPFDSELEKGG